MLRKVDNPTPPTYYFPDMASERFQRRIERLLDEADEAISRYDWESVRQAAQAVLAIDPENADGMTFLATVERALGESSAAASSSEPATTTPPAAQTVTSAEPTSFAHDRYQVTRFLGEGGKKKVYLAHDTLLDREVAFALIKTEELDQAGRSRIPYGGCVAPPTIKTARCIPFWSI